MIRDYVYGAEVLRWIYGDTLDVRADLGFDRISLQIRLRVLGFDAPEVRGATREAGLAAARKAAELAPVDSWVLIRTHHKDSFGRWLANVELADGRDFAAAMRLV